MYSCCYVVCCITLYCVVTLMRYKGNTQLYGHCCIVVVPVIYMTECTFSYLRYYDNSIPRWCLYWRGDIAVFAVAT